jgi:hypothetical protein
MYCLERNAIHGFVFFERCNGCSTLSTPLGGSRISIGIRCLIFCAPCAGSQGGCCPRRAPTQWPPTTAAIPVAACGRIATMLRTHRPRRSPCRRRVSDWQRWPLPPASIDHDDGLEGKRHTAKTVREHVTRILMELAPRAGLEPATLRLTGWRRSSILLILRACDSGAILLLPGVRERIGH